MATSDHRVHWNHVYQSRAPTEVSWYQPTPLRSLDLIRGTGLGPAAPIIDVGGGASLLVDHLLDLGFGDVTVLDFSAAALTQVRSRLGHRIGSVTLAEANLLEFVPSRQYALWHDRAVYHFLTERDDRCRYAEVLSSAVQPHGHVIVATFGPGGPLRCSGLDVVRYSPAQLAAALGPALCLEEVVEEQHQTPGGAIQEFVYCRFRAAA